MAQMEPVIGNWYYDADSERSFEVINFDEDDGLVEIRYEDGDNEECLLDAWYERELEPGAPSGHWRADDEELPEEEGGPRGARDEDELSDEALRRASQWGERSPDDFDERGHDMDES